METPTEEPVSRPGGTRVCPGRKPKGVCALLRLGFQHPAWPSPQIRGRRREPAAEGDYGMATTEKRKLNWWQWGLIGFLGIAGLGALLDPAEKREPVAAQTPDSNAEFSEIGGEGTFAMTFNDAAAPNAIEGAARERCSGRQWCMVLGWSDPASKASTMPMTDRELEALDFRLIINRSTGADEMSWTCEKWEARVPSCVR